MVSFPLKVPISVGNDSVLTLEHIQQLTGNETQQTLTKIKLKQKVLDSLEERRRNIQASVSQTSNDQFMLTISTLGESYKFVCWYVVKFSDSSNLFWQLVYIKKIWLQTDRIFCIKFNSSVHIAIHKLFDAIPDFVQSLRDWSVPFYLGFIFINCSNYQSCHSTQKSWGECGGYSIYPRRPIQGLGNINEHSDIVG